MNKGKIFLFLMLGLGIGELTACGKKELTCLQGKLVDENTCLLIETSEPMMQCEAGYEYDMTTATCKKEEVIDANVQRTCPKGYYQSNGTCYSEKSVAKVNAPRCAKNQQEYNEFISSTPTKGFWKSELKGNSCDYFFCDKYVSGSCVYAQQYRKGVIQEKVCPDGTYHVGNDCKNKSNGIITYTCPEDYEKVNNNQCKGTKIKNPKYICEEGIYNEETRLCEKKIESEPSFK